eukprot:scaffold236401_cov29-Tisochrysis_lutea.AAC.2
MDGSLPSSLSRRPVLHADAGEVADDDALGAEPTETLAKPKPGGAGAGAGVWVIRKKHFNNNIPTANISAADGSFKIEHLLDEGDHPNEVHPEHGTTALSFDVRV